MRFKYHKGYKGFYLLDNNKFQKPVIKLNVEATKENLLRNSIVLETTNESILEIDEKYVVLFSNNKKLKNNTKKKYSFSLSNSILLKFIPKILLDKLASLVLANENNDKFLYSVFDILENILYSDALFRTKTQKMFYFSDKELETCFEKYFTNIKIDNTLLEDIKKNYPLQYIEKSLPLDYKEKEMVYVFFFIITVELFSILK